VITRLVDAIVGLSGGVAYTVVGLLTFAEAAAFVGLVVPGEVAVLLGGVLAFEQRVSLPLMIAVAVLAAIVGDSVGYEVGARYGRRLIEHPRLARHRDAVVRTQRYLQERGGAAVFLGRWTSVLRALVPGLAGMSRMPYGRFLVANVLGGAAWATTFTLLGYAAGASYRQVERVAGRVSLVLLGLVVIAVGLQWAIAHQEALRGWAARVTESEAVRWVRGRYPGQVRWVADRFDPRVSRGLALTAVVVALLAAGWAVGAVTQDVYGHDELALIDPTIVGWFADHHSDVGAAVAGVVLRMAQWPWAAATLLAAAALLWWWQGRHAAGRVLAGGVGGWAIAAGAQRLLPVPASGTAFPAASPALVAGAAVMVTAVVGRTRGWAAGARAAAVGAMLVVIVGTAGLVTGDSAFTDVVAGAAIGATWALALVLQAQAG
jgi:membrane protein DedA with SNARE-associated domain